MTYHLDTLKIIIDGFEGPKLGWWEDWDLLNGPETPSDSLAWFL